MDGPIKPMKTPISILQELCTKRSLTPIYDLIACEGAAHQPKFVYRVTVGEHTANGDGTSKKQAKHNAAENVLEQFNVSVPKPSTPSQDASNGSTEADGNSVYNDGIPGNPVGQLQELVVARHWRRPDYIQISECGPPHSREFIIACRVHSFQEQGKGRSKKIAKRAAAWAMLQRIQDLPPDAEIGPADYELDTGAGVPSNISKSKSLTLWGSLHNPSGEKVTRLKSSSLSVPDTNYCTLLQELAEEQNFEVRYIPIEELSQSGQHQCLVQLSTTPVAVCHGTGQTVDDCRAEAAHNALLYLKIMARKALATPGSK
ncbi:RISC-loading complex subunit tarbp2-like [Saccoglossus kowalevskii]|uniref:Probable RISC-loading complex subunit BRAFLDRAFT_242885-like n=1 Tax=Saccoglossus kowalevskii TaxID=10224 RepID=A0ABM0GX06_SACKO|nr:PREDICTED: probable RISC-loading complex subunit BRAFLDRAFT_242885-like [Saccoglossus kowalevskii]